MISDSLHEVDGAAPELRILDPSERFDEREPVTCREEVGHMSRRRRRALRLGRTRYAGDERRYGPPSTVEYGQQARTEMGVETLDASGYSRDQ